MQSRAKCPGARLLSFTPIFLRLPRSASNNQAVIATDPTSIVDKPTQLEATTQDHLIAPCSVDWRASMTAANLTGITPPVA